MTISKIDRETYFRKKRSAKCNSCKKKITPETAIVGYNTLFCKECYRKFSKQAKEEVNRAFGEMFSEEDSKDEIENIKKRLFKLENEIKKLKRK